jgi:hypothetical protein
MVSRAGWAPRPFTSNLRNPLVPRSGLLFCRPLNLYPEHVRFYLPTRATAVPAAPEWFHEIKHDGYPLRLERDGTRVRLITRQPGLDEANSLDVEAVRKNRRAPLAVTAYND